MNVHSTKLWCTLVLENITNIKVLDKHLSIELKHGLLNHHIRRIEATVVTENINAIELFKGMGFQIEVT